MADKIGTKSKLTATEFSQLPQTLLPMELIHGEIIHMPAPKQQHQDVVLNVAVFLRHVSSLQGGRVVIAPMDVYLDDDNVVQPDVMWIKPTVSACRLGDDGWWHGAPDLIVEVLSPGTARHDRVVKFRLYEQFGVHEYWIVDPLERLIEVWQLQQEKFIRLGIYDIAETFESPILNTISVATDVLFADTP